MRAEDLLNAWDQGLNQPLPVEQPKTPKTAEELLDDWDADNAGFLTGIKDMGASFVASVPATAQGIVGWKMSASGSARRRKALRTLHCLTQL